MPSQADLEKTFAELEVETHEDGSLLFPGVLRKRNAKGVVEEIKCKVRSPKPAIDFQARVDARRWFNSLEGLDPDRDREVFVQMEKLSMLALVIRENETPFSQMHTAQELTQYEEGSLQGIIDQIDHYKLLEDPREQVVDEETFWKYVAQVAGTATLIPLVDIAGPVQSSFIVRMAQELYLLRADKSSADSSETSKADSSPSTK